MEAMKDKDYNRLQESAAEQNVLKQEYEYILNRERKIVRKKKELLNKLLKLREILKSG